MKSKVLCGNNIAVLKQFPDNHFDSIVTDPPYGIDFLGKSWDANVGALETYEQCLRVLKPGGHIIAFSAARTYHHLAVTIEQAGFEIRDQIMWIYGSGFPKSQDIGRQIQKKLGVKETQINPSSRNVKEGEEFDSMFHEKRTRTNLQIKATDDAALEWSGWGTALKPAHEPMVLARKPISEKNIADNCQKWGVGAINIDATRVAMADGENLETFAKSWDKKGGFAEMKKLAGTAEYGECLEDYDAKQYAPEVGQGRFPANIIHDGSDEVVSMFPNSKGCNGSVPDAKVSGYGEFGGGTTTYTPNNRTKFNSGEGSAARFFYCPKVSRRERQIGMGNITVENTRPRGEAFGDSNIHGENVTGNNHPTVKPIELMKYLIKLVTKPGGRVLDPFNGSGSTGCAAVELDYDYTGIDLDPNYVAISEKRIQAWYDSTHQPVNVLFKEEE